MYIRVLCVGAFSNDVTIYLYFSEYYSKLLSIKITFFLAIVEELQILTSKRVVKSIF